ncbi:MAG: hypothetical protein AAF770_01335 [Bacteroidota bacterium]
MHNHIDQKQSSGYANILVWFLVIFLWGGLIFLPSCCGQLSKEEKKESQLKYSHKLEIKKTENIPSFSVKNGQSGKVHINMQVRDFIYEDDITYSHIFMIRGCAFQRVISKGDHRDIEVVRTNPYTGTAFIKLILKDNVPLQDQDKEVTILSTNIHNGFLDLNIGSEDIAVAITDQEGKFKEASSSITLKGIFETMEQYTDSTILYTEKKKADTYQGEYPSLTINYLAILDDTLYKKHKDSMNILKTTVLPIAGATGITYGVFSLVSSYVKEGYEPDEDI